MKNVRVDKWLWTVRLFKSRTLATTQCKKGRITVDGKPVKPSHLIEQGDILGVYKDGFNLIIRVVDLLKNRVSAKLAAPCYEDLTTEEERNKFNDWYIGKGRSEFREKGAGRPTKKERREIDAFKDERFYEWLLDE
ncbi:MAG: RNA-binding S4 domain-containing protein [Saprospiraceae bacterium]|nr:RNA-binding S4 domain-containing protein [Saprospiraceae bacterium]